MAAFTRDDGDEPNVQKFGGFEDEDDFKPTRGPNVAAAEDMEDEDDFNFAPEVMLQSGKIAHYSVGSRVLVLWSRKAGVPLPREWDFWSIPFNEIGAFCTFVGAIGSKRLTIQPLVKYSYEEAKEIEKFSTEAIKASFVKEKIKMALTFTDRTLIKYLSDMRATQFLTKGKFRALRPEGYGAEVNVNIYGDDAGRVESGGEEVCKWLGAMTKTPIVYVQVSEEAKRVIRYLFSIFTLEFGKDEIGFKETNKPKGNSLFDATYQDVSTQNYTKTCMRLLQKAYEKISNRPTGIGSAKEPHGYAEILLENHLRTVPKVRAQVSEAVKTEFPVRLEKVKDRLCAVDPDMFQKSGRYSPALVSKVRNPKEDYICAAAGKVAIKTYDQLAGIVDKSRTIIRLGTADIQKKSDAHDAGCMGAGVSVPQKVHNAMETLKLMVNITGCVADAWGTAAKNHWEHELGSHGLKEIHYYDKEPKYAPLPPARFTEGNVLKIPENSREGRLVFDDTLVVPEKYSETDRRQAQELAKVKSILGAKYEGGFIKAYLGVKEDAGVRISSRPKALSLVFEAYQYVELVDGGSPHSPEYFIVFAHKRVPPLEGGKTPTYPEWRPPSIVKGEKFFIFSHPGMDKKKEIDPNSIRKEMGVAIDTWLSVKIIEMIRSNLWMNAQVSNGFYRPFGFQSILTPVFILENYIMSGRKTFTSAVDTVNLDGGVKGGGPEMDDVFSKTTTWDDEPESSSAGAAKGKEKKKD